MTEITTGEAPTHGRVSLGVPVDFHILCLYRCIVITSTCKLGWLETESVSWAMIICEGKYHRRSTHACVRELEGKGGLSITHTNSWSYTQIPRLSAASRYTPVVLWLGGHVAGYIVTEIATGEARILSW